MTILKKITLLGLLLIMLSCQQTKKATFLILPTPQQSTVGEQFSSTVSYTHLTLPTNREV